ncbi:hypothetical protein BGX28_003929 [Mortierella sp. GBA30]|nr:hypothetical protein BGX28_003929 [Mortierella sp. GBA30]
MTAHNQHHRERDIIRRIEDDIRRLEVYLNNHDTEELELDHVIRFIQGRSLKDFIRSSRKVELRSPDRRYTIAEIVVEESIGVKVKETQGGKGYGRWVVKLIRKFNQSGRYTAKLYARKCDKYRVEIQDNREILAGRKRQLNDLLWNQKTHAEIGGSWMNSDMDQA